jgi:hypothetical protein
MYEMVSSWSTHEKLECIYYMENNKAFTLTNGGKVSFLLPPTILAKGSQVHKELFFCSVERDVALSLLLGEQLYDVVLVQ